MKPFLSYTFTILRYVHDTTTGEFINSGLLLYSPNDRRLHARVRTTYGRLTRAFPDADGDAFKRAMAHIERAVHRISADLSDLFPVSGASVIDFAHRVVPLDDGSLQWSPVGSGRSQDLARETDKLFERFVLRYEKGTSEARSDEDVWKSFSRALEKRSVLGYLRDKEIASDADRMTFKHAWKNGVWHCLEPVSFDLVDGESIRQKALRWVGQMTTLSNADERFKLYMLIGEPKHVDVQPHYARALRILDKMPVDKVVFTEAQADELSAVISREIQQHSTD